MLQFQPAHSDIRNNNDRQRHCCGCELNHTVTSEGLAQAHVFLQATQDPFQIDWYLHAQSLIPAVHMVCNNDAMHNDILEGSSNICVVVLHMIFEIFLVIMSALKLNYFVLNSVPVEAIALVIKIPLMRHVKGYNHKIHLHFP
ncbi:hypothetical protein Tco_0892407 [Tanacetum coccineum]|uniref:Uncharacterized protein n=1 Tax=Tanacetum coccineum TaxID=301880 RepID=A0ABQ5C5S9_9ASTR